MSARGTRKPTPAATDAADPEQTFPIVGIGASAGGLEALEQFFGSVPANSGMAFVVIQHLDPERPAMLAELLQRNTPMPVVQAGDRMKVGPDCVYVIPPNKELSILHDTLYLLNPQAAHGLRLPIDVFLSALAEDRRERSIGVILSGMGSDGTLGLKAIKAHGGLTLAQEPTSAKFDSMPGSVVRERLADIVAPAGELPRHIRERTRPFPKGDRPPTKPDPAENPVAFDKACILLRSRTGHDFSLYKKSTVYRRIERRMLVQQIDRLNDYLDFLHENPQEIDLLFKELLIGVTSFFRDPAIWAFLQESAFPDLIAAYPQGGPLRAWVAGCSTGEEAYTLAILFKETLEQQKPPAPISLQIFATDLDPDAIDRARQGLYPASIANEVSSERLTRFFTVEEGGSYRISKEIRQMVVFAQQNVIMDPPFTKLDILTCRNLLIYLGQDLQRKLLPLFHYSLKPGGILCLGSAESIGNFGDLFSPLNSQTRIYRRQQIPRKILDVDFPIRPPSEAANTFASPLPDMHTPNLQTLADQLLLQRFSPAAVLVNATGDILFINGRTGKYLEPAAGKANWNIHAMAREGLRQELAIALPKALRTQEPEHVRNLTIGSNGGTQVLDLTVFPVQEPAALAGMAMLVFNDVAPPAKGTPRRRSSKSATDARVLELELELQRAKEEIQSIREEMQSSHEELKSANEELQSTNEELQSTNEELTTSKEEMQSLNEELQTVNVELQSKVDELSATSNDMKNLLNSTDIATIFLDNQLHVRRFTRQATQLFKLINSDIGRPLTDIVNELDYPTLHDDAGEVLRTLIFSEKQITSQDHRWFLVRIMPYRTLENVIDGVVITLIDISEAKRLEAELRAARTGKGEKNDESP
jgi:chemotaxis methyl-accepting protein methylase